MKYKVKVLVGKAFECEVEAENEEEAEDKAVLLAKQDYEEKGIENADFFVDSVVNTEEEKFE